MVVGLMDHSVIPWAREEPRAGPQGTSQTPQAWCSRLVIGFKGGDLSRKSTAKRVNPFAPRACRRATHLLISFAAAHPQEAV
jgi:hypothetical protein